MKLKADRRRLQGLQQAFRRQLRLELLEDRTMFSAGSLDTTFDTDGIVTTNFGQADGIAYAVALQSDGKSVMVGSNNGGLTSDFVIARYTTSGALDTSFAGSGKIITDFGTGDGVGQGVAIQSDGKILVAGYGKANNQFDMLVARYNTNGTLDTTFAGGAGFRLVAASTTLQDYGSKVAVDSTGRIVIGGTIVSATYDFAVARLLANGTLDSSFGSGGVMTTDVSVGKEDSLEAIVIQSDNKIVAGGRSSNGSNYDFAITRITTSGAVDTSFGSGGKVITAIGSGNDSLTGLAISASSKIVAGGYSYNGSNYDFAAVQLTSTGAYDTSFGSNGRVTVPIQGSNDAAYAVYADTSTGKVTLAGYSTSGVLNDFAMVRLTASGAADNTFGSSGRYVFSVGTSDDVIQAIAYSTSGSYYIVAGFHGATKGNEFAIAKVSGSGVIDTTFNSVGSIKASYGESEDFARSVAIQTDGKTLIAGYTSVYGKSTFAITRYNLDGSLDTTFGTSGKTVSSLRGYKDVILGMTLQTDGKIVVVGYSNNAASNSDFVVARYTTAGVLDSSFGITGTGFTATDIGSTNQNNVARTVVVQPDGRIVVAGYSFNGTNYDYAIVRYTSTGAPDGSFGSSGQRTIAVGSANDYAYAIALQPDSKILIAGNFEVSGGSDVSVIRLIGSNGANDSSFGSFGVRTYSVGINDFVSDVAVRTDGRILIGGSSQSGSSSSQDYYFTLAQLQPNGTSFDSSFGTAGIASIDFGSTRDESTGFELQTDGSVLAGGFSYDGTSTAALLATKFSLARVTANGVLDTAFGTSGKVQTVTGSTTSPYAAVARGTDNRVVLAGSSDDGLSSNFISARYLSDPATRTWDGGGSDNNWSTAANWVGDIAPASGDSLVFDSSVAGLTKFTATNTFANFEVGSITVKDTSSTQNFRLEGQSIIFRNGGTIIDSQSGDTTYALSITASLGGKIISLGDSTFSSAIASNVNSLEIQSSGDVYVFGVISGTSGLVKSGNSMLTLSGNNSYLGATTIQGGTVRLSDQGTLGATSASTTVQANTTLLLAAGRSFYEPINLAGNLIGSYIATQAASVLLTSSNSTISTYDEFTISGDIIESQSGTEARIYPSNGTIKLSGMNQISGKITFGIGNSEILNSFTIPSTTPLKFVSADVEWKADSVVGSIEGSGAIHLGASFFSLGYDNTSTTFQGSIVGGSTNRFSKVGSGTFAFSQSGSFSGPTSIVSGTLKLTGTASLSDTAIVSVEANAMLQIDESSSEEKIGGIEGDGSVELKNGIVLELAPDTQANFSGSISGIGSVRKSGSGSQTFYGSHSYSGATEIAGGWLTLAGINNLPITSSVNFTSNSGGVLNLNSSQLIGGLSSVDSFASVSSGFNNLEIRSNNDQAFAGSILGSGTLIKSGVGTLILSGNNPIPTNVQIVSGKITLGSNGIVNNVQSLAIDGGVLDPGQTFNSPFGVFLNSGSIIGSGGTLSASGIQVLGGVIDNVNLVGPLAKLGSGRLNISGIYSNLESVSLYDGIFHLNGSVTTSVGPIELLGSAIVAGVGSLGDVVANGGSPAISPGLIFDGNSTIGQLHLQSLDVQGASNAHLVMQIAGTIPGITQDLLEVENFSSITGLDLQLSSLFNYTPQPNDHILLVRNNSSVQLGVNGNQLRNLPEGSKISLNGVDVTLTYMGGDGNDIELIAEGGNKVSGTVFMDANANGTRDQGEAGMPSIQVYADLNNNGTFESNEPTTLTIADSLSTAEDESGRYVLSLPDGGYVIRRSQQLFTAATFPDGPLANINGLPTLQDSFQAVTIQGQDVTNVDFGNVFKIARFTNPAVSVSEESGIATIDLDLDSPFPFDLTVPLYSQGLSATQGVDFSIDATTVTFPANSTHASFQVQIINDSRYEANETFKLIFGDGYGIAAGYPTEQIVTIVNDDALPVIQFTSTQVITGEIATTINVIANLDRVSDFPITVPILLGGTATNNSDYKLLSGLSYTIPSGTQSLTVPVTIVDDTLAELAETIILDFGTLTGATKSTLAASSTRTIRILANDAPTITLTKVAQTVTEKPTPLSTVTVVATLSSPAATNLSIPFTLSSSSGSANATLGSDFSYNTGSFYFAGPFGASAGSTSATVTLTIINDNVAEPTENVALQLDLSNQPDVLQGSTTTQSITIYDDDRNVISFAPTTVSKVWEDQGTVSVVVQMTNAASSEVRVPVTAVTTSGGAINGQDFTLTLPANSLGNTLVFAPGQTSKTISLNIINDSVLDERDENISLQLGTPVNAEIDQSHRGYSLTIRDDDPTITLVTSQTVTEPNSGTSVAKVMATLSEPTNKIVRWRLNSVSGSADGNDVALPSSASDGFRYVTIPASTLTKDVTTASFDVQIKADNVGEPKESYTLAFEKNVGSQTLTNAVVGNRKNGTKSELANTHTIYIDANDTPGISISASNKNLQENSGTVNFTVSISNPSMTDIVVPVTYKGTATKSSDYDNVTSAVTIKAGKTSVTGSFRVVDDTLNENDETIIVNVGSATSGTASIGSPSSITFTIAANDKPVNKPPAIQAGQVALNPTSTKVVLGPASTGPQLAASETGSGKKSYPIGVLAVGGYISGGTAFFDGNKNGVLDFLDINQDGFQDEDEPSEPSTQSSLTGLLQLDIDALFDRNEDGEFDTSEGQFVITGGIDTSIDLPLVGSFIAPAGIYVPTPLTTLMATLINEQSFSLDDASVRVQLSLGLPARDLKNFDQLAATLAGDIAGPEVFRAEVKVQDTIASVATFLAALPLAPPIATLASITASAMATKITESDSFLDLSNSAVIQSILENVALDTGLTIVLSQFEGAAEVIAASNHLIDDVVMTVDEAYLTEVARVQKVSQTATLSQLVQVAQGTLSIADVVSQNTGASLMTKVSQVVVDNIVPPFAAVFDSSIVEVDIGTNELVFTIGLTKSSTSPVSVTYYTQDNSATAGSDYVSSTGTLTWAPGDSSLRYVHIAIYPDVDLESDESFGLVLDSPQNVEILRDLGLGTIINDDQISFYANDEQDTNEIVLALDDQYVSLTNNNVEIIAGQFSGTGYTSIAGTDETDDTLILDFLTSSTFIHGGIEFDGAEGNDAAVIRGGQFESIVHQFRGFRDATTVLRYAGDDAEIEFESTNLETFTIDSIVEQLTIQLPEDETTAILEDADPTDLIAPGMMRLRSPNDEFESFLFKNPTQRILILGGDGLDHIQIDSLDPAFVGTIQIDTDAVGTDGSTVDAPDWNLVGSELISGRTYGVFSKSSTAIPPLLKIQVDNLPPTSISIQTVTSSVPENTLVDHDLLVADNLVIQDDAFGTNTVTLGGADASSFKLVGTSLYLKSGTVLNYELKSSLTVQLRVDDSSVGIDPDAVFNFTLNVSDVNEAPTDVLLSNSFIRENVAIGSTIGSLTSTDPDATGTFTYTLASGNGGADNAFFTIDAQGALRTNTTLNYESKNSYSVRVRSTDQGGLFTDKVISVQVANSLEISQPITIGDGSLQRSIVKQLVIDFDQAISVDAGAFAVQQRVKAANGTLQLNAVTTNVIVSSLGPQGSRATITFSGVYAVAGSGSLVDGNYQLSIDGSKIRIANTLETLDSNNNGVTGSTRVIGNQSTDKFYALLGDVNGNAEIDAQDLLGINNSYRSRAGQSNYVAAYDINGNAQIDAQDLLAVQNNYRKKRTFF